MKGSMLHCLPAAAVLIFAAAEYSMAQNDCAVFAASPGATRHEYASCDECLEHHERCEERCGSEEGYVCTAEGYDRNDVMQLVQGRFGSSERQARRIAIRQCQDQGLQDCSASRCVRNASSAGNEVRPCRERGGPSSLFPENRSRRNERPHRNEPEPPIVPPVVAPMPPQPGPRCVVSWQHIKERCESRPYEKILKQCPGNINFWHGIYCQVTWSDGRREDVHGKVDLTDPCGRQYCTRASRPANFNCVSQCDDTPGPLMTLPR